MDLQLKDRRALVTGTSVGIRCGIAKALSRRVGPHGVTVNGIPRGRSHGERILRNGTTAHRQWQAGHQIPMRRRGEPEDIAHRVCFLASPLAGCIPGAVMPVDDGLRRDPFCDQGQP